MTGDFVSGADGLSLRSRPKVAGILPLLKMIDNLNHTAAEIEIDMAMGENWLIREPLVEISRKMIAEGFTTQVRGISSAFTAHIPKKKIPPITLMIFQITNRS